MPKVMDISTEKTRSANSAAVASRYHDACSIHFFSLTFFFFLTVYSPRSSFGYNPFANVSIPSCVRVALAYISLSMIGTTRSF